MDALEEGKDLTLPDGVVVPLRAIRPDDTRALQGLHGRLSELSIRLRYHSSMKELRDRIAKHLACVDGVNRFALVALDPEKQEQIIAVVPLRSPRGHRQGRVCSSRGGSLARARVGFSHDLPTNRCGS